MTRLVRGGAERQMVLLAEHLPREEFEVEFLALSGPGDLDRRVRLSGLPVLYVDPDRAGEEAALARVTHRGLKALRYARLAARRRYDVIDAWLQPIDALAVLMRPFTRTPAVVAGRRNLSDLDARPRSLVGRATAVLARQVDAVVVNSQAGLADVHARERLTRSKVRVIHNGVPLISDRSPEEIDAARRGLGVSPGDTVIGAVGSLTRVKRVDVILNAYAELLRADARLRLVVIGEGPERPHLERLCARLGVAERAVFTGSVEEPERLLGLLDVVVQASRSEGLPNALLEAASAGRAIVATDVGGTREVLDDGRAGLLVAAGDDAAMAAALQRVVTDPSLRERLGVAARAHVARRFSVERFVAEFADLYRELAERAADRAQRKPG